ncbi:MAG: hypothetical protein VKP72_14015 [bacterium]|nr:hypothetical protein [bacterium]
MSGTVNGPSSPSSVFKAARTTKLEWPLPPDGGAREAQKPGDVNLTGATDRTRSEMTLTTRKASSAPAPVPTGEAVPAAERSAADQQGLDTLKTAFAQDPLALQQVTELAQTLSTAEQSGLWSRLAGQLNQSPRAETGLASGQALVKQIVQDLADPGSVYQGLATTTCTTASLQAILARTQPAEYARLAGDLLTTGKATLKDGSGIESRPADFSVNEGRNPLADALQEAFLRRGLAEPAGGDTRGVGGTGRGSARASFAGTFQNAARRVFAGETGGLTVNQYQALFKAVTGQANLTIPPDGMWDTLGKMTPKQLEAITVMLKPGEGATSGHAVTLESFQKRGDNWYVKFNDPEKPGHAQEMKVGQFKKQVEFLAVDPTLASKSKTFLNDFSASRKVGLSPTSQAKLARLSSTSNVRSNLALDRQTEITRKNLPR